MYYIFLDVLNLGTLLSAWSKQDALNIDGGWKKNFIFSDGDPFISRSVVKTDSCPYLVKYSPDVLMTKTKRLDITNVDKKCFI